MRDYLDDADEPIRLITPPTMTPSTPHRPSRAPLLQICPICLHPVTALSLDHLQEGMLAHWNRRHPVG